MRLAISSSKGDFVGPIYEFFRLNVSGVVDTSERMSLQDDATARQHATLMHHKYAVEIWAAKRKVGVVPGTRG